VQSKYTEFTENHVWKDIEKKNEKKNYSDRRLHDFTSWNISISKLVLKQKKIKKNKEGETREKRDIFKL
jgi:hypothetical protein